MKISATLLSCLALGLIASPSFANDSSASVNTQGLVLEKTDKIAMKKELLKISPGRIEVEYEFLNESDSDIETVVAFPIPVYSCANPYQPNEVFSDFKASIEGKKIDTKFEIKAQIEDKDVSDVVRKYGLLQTGCPDISKLDPKRLKILKLEGVTTPNEDGGGEDIAAWSIHAKYYWSSLFPAKKLTKVVHSYRPRLGSDSVGSIYLDSQSSVKDELMTWASEHSNRTSTNGSYVLTTGNNWKNGIESFDLTIEGSQLVWAYLDGTLYAGIGKLRFAKKNYHPTQDLHFVFGAVNKDIPPQFYEKQIIDGPANLRSTPGGSVIASIPDKSNVQVIDYAPQWFKIKYQDKTGFTNEKNIVHGAPGPIQKGKLKSCRVSITRESQGETSSFTNDDPKADEQECLEEAEAVRKQQIEFYKVKVLLLRASFGEKVILEKKWQ